VVLELLNRASPAVLDILLTQQVVVVAVLQRLAQLAAGLKHSLVELVAQVLP
jgi:hypothetical protein